MNTNDDSVARDFDPDTAPDLSRDGWPEKFAAANVRPESTARNHDNGEKSGLGSRPQTIPKGSEDAT